MDSLKYYVKRVIYKKPLNRLLSKLSASSDSDKPEKNYHISEIFWSVNFVIIDCFQRYVNILCQYLFAQSQQWK